MITNKSPETTLTRYAYTSMYVAPIVVNRQFHGLYANNTIKSYNFGKLSVSTMQPTHANPIYGLSKKNK